jgi:hypothetical protein
MARSCSARKVDFIPEAWITLPELTEPEPISRPPAAQMALINPWEGPLMSHSSRELHSMCL